VTRGKGEGAREKGKMMAKVGKGQRDKIDVTRGKKEVKGRKGRGERNDEREGKIWREKIRVEKI
jgi:hypothetical protein